MSITDITNNTSLLSFMLPIQKDTTTESSLMMPTEFSKSSMWRSLVIVGQSQVQKNGLLFQAALTFASLGKQVTFIMKKEFTKLPPTTHSFPKSGAENMANITFKYCRELKDVGALLISFCSTPTDLLPDVLVLNCLNDCFSEGSPEPNENQISKIISLATETTEYIGRRKQQPAILFVSLALAKEQANLEKVMKKWIHEVWILEGNSNRLVCGDLEVQFTILGSSINLKTVSSRKISD